MNYLSKVVSLIIRVFALTLITVSVLVVNIVVPLVDYTTLNAAKVISATDWN
jgi:hypothetical protein